MNSKIIVAILIYFFGIFKSFSQEKKVEDIFQECIYNTLPDKGKKLKKYSKDYEAYLISVNLLKDSTGISYKELLQFLKKPKNANKLRLLKYSYIDSLLSYGKEMKELFSNSECLKEIILRDDFDVYIRKAEKITPNMAHDVDNFFVNVDSLFTEKDLELPYYKQKFLALFSIYNELFSLDSE
ncbi:hypothetical protein ACQY1Q_10785 [Tenacibaculum sp. TC6]|uniref:hypothetical protein n=1 Tax=Tenacibaculum sp. TC6 TaxID=3423223 RepID=UPI003D363433